MIRIEMIFKRPWVSTMKKRNVIVQMTFPLIRLFK